MTLGEKISTKMTELNISKEELLKKTEIKEWVMDLILKDLHYPENAQLKRLSQILKTTPGKLGYNKKEMTEFSEKKPANGLYFVEYTMPETAKLKYGYRMFLGGKWFNPRYSCDGKIIEKIPVRNTVTKWMEIK
jgi:hypothetical protein